LTEVPYDHLVFGLGKVGDFSSMPAGQRSGRMIANVEHLQALGERLLDGTGNSLGLALCW
jgi:hypothetical protein